MKLRTFHLFILSGFLALSGIVHGMWSHRWSSGSEVEGKNLLAAIDGDISDWQAGDFVNLDPASIPEKTVCYSRKFMSTKSNKPFMVSITSGSPGSVAVHTPDVCYLGAGYKLRGAVTRQTIALGDGGSAAFWVGDFVKTSATGSESIRVRWSWTADGLWQAPDYPRWVFARVPVLYKLYIVHPLSDEDDLTRDDPYRKFVADLIPALSRQLVN
jgi:hypothetical protein